MTPWAQPWLNQRFVHADHYQEMNAEHLIIAIFGVVAVLILLMWILPARRPEQP